MKLVFINVLPKEYANRVILEVLFMILCMVSCRLLLGSLEPNSWYISEMLIVRKINIVLPILSIGILLISLIFRLRVLTLFMYVRVPLIVYKYSEGSYITSFGLSDSSMFIVYEDTEGYVLCSRKYLEVCDSFILKMKNRLSLDYFYRLPEIDIQGSAGKLYSEVFNKLYFSIEEGRSD